MKKIVTIVIIVLLALGLGFFLFRISPQQQAATNAGANFDLSGVTSKTEPAAVAPQDHILGNPNAKNTLIAYEDYQCPACAAENDILNQIPSALQDTKLVYRYFPLYQIHKNAIVSAYAAEAAGAQGKFWEMHNLLFQNQDAWAELDNPIDEFAKLAQQAGVSNLDQFKSEIASGKYKDRIQKDLVESLSLNLPGTPSLFFNGKTIKSGSLDSLKSQAEPLYFK